MKYSKLFAIIVFAHFLFLESAEGQTKVISAFQGGIDQTSAKLCQHQIEQSQCKLKDLFMEYKRCVQKVLVHNSECKQSLIFFKLTDGGIFHTIHTYDSVDVILADYVYIADQGTGYFLVTHKGLFLPIPLNISKKSLKRTAGYELLSKKYLRVTAFRIKDFPYYAELPNNTTRLVFTQQLTDGCTACAHVGTIKVAYDFSSDGKVFKGIKTLKITPNPQNF